MVGVTGLATVIIYHKYDPSKRYQNYMRKSIKDAQKDLDFKVLVCIHNEENVSPMIDLLQVCKHSKNTPFSVFVLHLMELSGRTDSILTKDEIFNKSSAHEEAFSKRIHNAFDQFQRHDKENVVLECF